MCSLLPFPDCFAVLLNLYDVVIISVEKPFIFRAEQFAVAPHSEIISIILHKDTGGGLAIGKYVIGKTIVDVVEHYGIPVHGHRGNVEYDGSKMSDWGKKK